MTEYTRPATWEDVKTVARYLEQAGVFKAPTKPKRDARDEAEGAEHRAFSQQLPHHPSLSRAERLAQRQLFLPARAASEKEIRDVGASDEEHHADGSEQDEKRRTDGVGQFLVEQQDRAADVLDATEHLALVPVLHRLL